MKTLTKILFLSLILGSMTMCNKDDPGPSNSSNPEDFCTGGLCDNPAARQQCIDAYNTCRAVDQGDDEECKIIALGVCNL
jgi:hypothetical protein